MALTLVNAYLIAFVAVMPIAGRLSDVYGRRQVFVASYALFLVGTVVIPLSTTLGPFLIGRILTALGGGAMVPVALAVVGDVYPENRRSRALGALAAWHQGDRRPLAEVRRKYPGTVEDLVSQILSWSMPPEESARLAEPLGM